MFNIQKRLSHEDDSFSVLCIACIELGVMSRTKVWGSLAVSRIMLICMFRTDLMLSLSFWYDSILNSLTPILYVYNDCNHLYLIVAQ